MTEILRVKMRWSGFNGGPGYSVLHFRDFGTGGDGGEQATEAQAISAANRVYNFFTELTPLLPSIVRLDLEGDVDVVEDTTGDLINAFSIPTGAQQLGSGQGAFSAPTGSVVNWKTAGFRNSRRVRGRTFLVPLAGSAFGPDGALTAAARATIQDAATDLADSADTPDLGVYARPTGSGASDGRWYVCTGASVPTAPAILTSRRD